MREFALKFSIPVGAYDLADTTCHIAAAVGGKNPDGEAAYIAADKPECAVVSAAADIEHFRVRFPSCELHAMNEPMLSFSHEYAPEGETERAATLLNRALELICPGDSVELTGALWQSAEVRRGIEKKFTYLVESTGARCDAKIICAYKQGQSWLEESFAPRARDAGAARVLVRFDASGVSGVIYNEDGLELVPVPEKPPRRLREMYPADELAAAVMGIGREAVTFEGATALPHSYEAVAFDALGNQVLADAYSVRSQRAARAGCATRDRYRPRAYRLRTRRDKRQGGARREGANRRRNALGYIPGQTSTHAARENALRRGAFLASGGDRGRFGRCGARTEYTLRPHIQR